MKDFFTARAYFLGWSLIRRMPQRLADRLFNAIANRMYARGGKSVLRLRTNLARVTPD